MSDRLSDEQVARVLAEPDMQVGQIVLALTREVQARRLSDITTPICPTCDDGSGKVTNADVVAAVRNGMKHDMAHAVWGDPCPANCDHGHIPLKVWVGMLTDALRVVVQEIERDVQRYDWPLLKQRLDHLVALADSVTPKENE